MGRPVFELEQQLPLEELLEWRAFWRMKGEAEKKAIEKAKREAEAKSPRGRRR